LSSCSSSAPSSAEYVIFCTLAAGASSLISFLASFLALGASSFNSTSGVFSS